VDDHACRYAGWWLPTESWARIAGSYAGPTQTKFGCYQVAGPMRLDQLHLHDRTGDPATEWPPTDCGSTGLATATRTGGV
jgi:hypothetical protein